MLNINCNYIFCYICKEITNRYCYGNPFVVGKIATDKNFTDREQKTATLVVESLLIIIFAFFVQVLC